MFKLFFEIPENFIFLIPLLPLAGFIINAFMGKRIGEKGTGIIGCIGPLISFIISIGMVYSLSSGIFPAGLNQQLFEWVGIGSLHINVGFHIDQLTSIMILVVTGVGSLIHIYSIGYIHGDKSVHRYFAYLNLFMFAMLILVLADNLLLMFVGWEGVGLCSYLLIGFWFEDMAKAKAGKKAFLVNRIGDFGFLLAMFLLFTTFNTLEFSSLKGLITAPSVILTVTGFLLFLGATGKSAQIPLYVWLPDAMAGPTPVSALIHAATMVTAGVYMIGRLSFLFINAPHVLPVVAIVGCLTALFAATIGIAQNDIKKVLAYSTISQLGYMFLAMGVTAFSAGIFHLMTHAFFKGLLFLGAGSVIHAMGGEQDIRKMGGLAKKIPITFITFFIATLAIAGIPPFAGFFSKDEILWKTFERYETTHQPLYLILWIIGIIAALMTAFYMFRLAALTFFGKSRVEEETEKHIHESPFSMTFVLLVLAILSTIGGFLGIPKLLGGNNIIHHYLSSIFPVLHHSEVELSHSLEYLNMGISVGACAIIAVIALLLYTRGLETVRKIKEDNPIGAAINKMLINKYYIDEIYFALIVNPIKKLAMILYIIVDVLIIDCILNFTASLIRFSGFLLRKIQSGLIQDYLLYIMCSIILVLWFYIIKLF